MKISFIHKGFTFNQFTKEQALNYGVSGSDFERYAFDFCKKNQLLNINRACQNELDQLTKSYPAGEVSTFDKQEAEAKTYIADSNAKTPLIDALAAARAIEKPELVNRIIAKSEVFSELSGSLIGKRQALEDTLNRLSPETHSITDIQSVSW